jgi:hypothetical protein
MSFDKDRESSSVLLQYDRNCNLHIHDTDDIPNFDAVHPLTNLAVPVIVAGYTGVAVDKCVLRDGRHIYALEVNTATPEGRIFADLKKSYQCGDPLPTGPQLLNQIAEQYKRNEGKNEPS